MLFRLIFLFLPLCPLSIFSQERFPQPSQWEIKESNSAVFALGKAEIYTLPMNVLSQFLWDRYLWGIGENFCYYGCNPSFLTRRQTKSPATILLHASQSNQGEWLPLLHSMEKKNFSDLCGPVFTFNFPEGTGMQMLIKRIKAIRQIYLEAGANSVVFNFVGHSLGAIVAAEYAFNQEKWVENTTVNKVISIAGRLKNIAEPIDTPFYPYCYQTLQRIDPIYERIENNRGMIKLYTIAAENDWLVPHESVLIGDNEKQIAIISGKGHVLVVFAHVTRDLIIRWLLEKKASSD